MSRKKKSSGTRVPRGSKLRRVGTARRLHDNVTVNVTNLFLDKSFTENAVEDVAIELLALTRDLDATVAPDANSRLEGRDASVFVERLVTAWSAFSVRQLDWPSAKLLYAIRRLPIELLVAPVLFRHGIESSGASAATGVERLLSVSTGASQAAAAPVRTSLARYEFTQKELGDLIRHVLRLTHLWLLHGTARIVGKGVDIELDAHGFPRTQEDAETRRAMDHYDQRLRGMETHGLIGMDVWEIAESAGSHALLVVSPREGGSRWTQSTGASRARIVAAQSQIGQSAQAGDILLVEEKFEIKYVDLAGLGKVLDTARHVTSGLSPDLAPLVMLLHGLAQSQDLEMSEQLQRYGYLRVERRILLEWMRSGSDGLQKILRTDRKDPIEHLAQLVRLTGQIRPLRDGPVIHRGGDHELLVDVVAASRRLPWELLVGKDGGTLGSARGDAFEHAVRAKVRDAGAAPRDPNLQRLVGKKVKVNGKVITDLDAIAELEDGTVLVIQAKSYAYTPAYGAGEYAAVHSLTSNLTEALTSWPQKIERIFSGPPGASSLPYPSRTYIPLVVTPFPAYLPPRFHVNIAIKDLPSCVSIDELGNWLDGYRTRGDVRR